MEQKAVRKRIQKDCRLNVLPTVLRSNFQVPVGSGLFWNTKKKKMTMTKRPNPIYPHSQGIALAKRAPTITGPSNEPKAKKKW
jgi:hypothetical protein